MMKNLVVVESPTKARTLKKYLGAEFQIMASVGHVKDLPNNKLGVDMENGFTPEYVTIKGKGKILKEIKTAGKKAEAIYLAPDPDREGEAIAWHIAQELKSKGKEIYRVHRGKRFPWCHSRCRRKENGDSRLLNMPGHTGGCQGTD